MAHASPFHRPSAADFFTLHTFARPPGLIKTELRSISEDKDKGEVA
jgi:hypothetical protein